MTDSTREEHDLERFQALISQNQGDQESDHQDAGAAQDQQWNKNQAAPPKLGLHTKRYSVYGGGTSKLEIEQLMGELRDVSKEIKLVDEGSDLKIASGSENINECIAVRDKKIGQAVQIAECLYQEYIKFDDNFDLVNGKMHQMQLENKEMKENEVQLKSLVQKQMKELKALEAELEEVQRADQMSQDTIQQLKLQCQDLDRVVQTYKQDAKKKDKEDENAKIEGTDHSTDLAEIRNQNTQLQEANECLQKELDILNMTMSHKENEAQLQINQLSEMKEALTFELSQFENEYKKLKEQVKNLTSQNNSQDGTIKQLQVRLQLISTENDKLVRKNGRFSNCFGSDYRPEGAGLDVMSCEQQQIVLDRPLQDPSADQDHLAVHVSQQSPNANNDSYIDGQSEQGVNKGHIRRTSRADVIMLHQEFDNFVKSRRSVISRTSQMGPIGSRVSFGAERQLLKMTNGVSDREMLVQSKGQKRIPRKTRVSLAMIPGRMSDLNQRGIGNQYKRSVMSGLDAEVEENNPFSEEHQTEHHIASFISHSNLDQESQQNLHKIFANNYSPVKVQQIDDEADKVEETVIQDKDSDKAVSEKVVPEKDEAKAATSARVSIGGAKNHPVQYSGRQSVLSADPTDPMQIEKQFFKLLVLAELLNTPDALNAQSNADGPVDSLDPEEMFQKAKFRDGRQFNQFHEWITQYVKRIMYNVDDQFVNWEDKPQTFVSDNTGARTASTSTNGSSRPVPAPERVNRHSNKKYKIKRDTRVYSEWAQIEEEDSADEVSQMSTSQKNFGMGIVN